MGSDLITGKFHLRVDSFVFPARDRYLSPEQICRLMQLSGLTVERQTETQAHYEDVTMFYCIVGTKN